MIRCTVRRGGLRSILGFCVLLLPALLVDGGNAQAPDSDSAPADGPRVAASAIATEVVEREPVGSATRFPAGTEQLACFTDIRDAEGMTIVHAWIHEGTTRARVEITVKSARFRCWSTKRLLPDWTGQWEVKVLTGDGVVLATLPFVVE